MTVDINRDEKFQGPNVSKLKTWADARGFTIVAFFGNQQTPENGISVHHGKKVLVRGESLDSVDTAAAYVLNTLERLGVNVEATTTDQVPA